MIYRGKSMTKYEELKRFFQNQLENRIELTFSQIEKIISDKLPESAFKYRAWWANDKTHVHATAWLNVDWQVKKVDFNHHIVSFEKKKELPVKDFIMFRGRRIEVKKIN